MLSLEHPAIHLYSRDKNKMKIMVRNHFRDMLGTWTLLSIDKLIHMNVRHFISLSLTERGVLIDLLELEEDVVRVILRRRGIIIYKNPTSSWDNALKILNDKVESGFLRLRY